MNATKLHIEGLYTFEPRAFADERGAFFESYNERAFREATGFTGQFVQDNHSISHKGVVRGLHYQLEPHAQGKLVRVVQGAAWDVAVDIRRGSATFGQWAAVELTAENRRQFWIPAGFAHGFLALEDNTQFLYKTTDFWHGASERAIRWDDADIGIDWPLTGTPIPLGQGPQPRRASARLNSSIDGTTLNAIRLFVRQVFFPFLRLLIRAALMPGLIIGDWITGARLKRQGDVASIERFSEANDGTFCVFHLYQRYSLPANVVHAIELLSEIGVRVVAVSNLPVPAAELERIKPYLHTFIQRRNFGRDFGGYRRGVLHALDKHAPDRLMIFNDSIFYARRGLKEFFTEMAKGGFVGASENHEITHHIGSYALSFGSEVISDPRFREYWEDYRSTEVRPWVIRNGEAALSKLVEQTIKVRPRVIYSLQRLDAALSRSSWREVAVSASQMPANYHGQNPIRTLLHEARKPVRDAMPVSREALLETASLTVPLSAKDLVHDLNAQARRELQRDLLDYVFQGSQIHWGALLLTQYLQMPIIKLDLVLRSIYGPGELDIFAPYLTEDEFAEFHALVTARGEPMTHGTLKQKLMMMTGLM